MWVHLFELCSLLAIGNGLVYEAFLGMLFCIQLIIWAIPILWLLIAWVMVEPFIKLSSSLWPNWLVDVWWCPVWLNISDPKLPRFSKVLLWLLLGLVNLRTVAYLVNVFVHNSNAWSWSGCPGMHACLGVPKVSIPHPIFSHQPQRLLPSDHVLALEIRQSKVEFWLLQ